MNRSDQNTRNYQIKENIYIERERIVKIDRVPLVLSTFFFQLKNLLYQYQRKEWGKVKKQTYGTEINRSTSLNYICSIHCCQYKCWEKNTMEKTKEISLKSFF